MSGRDKRFFIIVVFYNPSTAQVERVLRLSESYNVIIVDNSPVPIPHVSSREDLRYIPLLSNRGIAYAQNVGIQKVKEMHGTYILFLDQDSDVDMDFPCDILSEFKRLESKEPKLVALGPVVYEKDTGMPYKRYNDMTLIDSSNYICPTLISSGTVSPTWAFDEVGFMEERLFIDYVDHEWCWRACSKGFVCCMNLTVKMRHKVGQRSIRCLGIPFLLASPFRYYYQYRNSCWLQTRKYVPADWKVKTAIRNLVGFFCIPWHTRSPFAVLRYMLKGLLHGCLPNVCLGDGRKTD